MERVQEDEAERRTEKKGIIKIPSYREVFGNSDGEGSSSTSMNYNPPLPASFSQAFSFIKSSEFYTPPPPSKEPQQEQTPRDVSLSQAPADTPPVASSSFSSSSTSPYSTVSAQNRNAILVSHRQKGNPLLKHIRNVRWVFADVVCDYLLGQSSCALYISLRYHLLHPDYLYYRIRELQKNFKLRVVLCHIDVEDVVKPLLEVTRTAMLHDCTLLCGWSLEECGRYLETIKAYENKPADSIREQADADYLSCLTHALTSIRRVNKTDVVTLGSTFGSLSSIMDASMEDLACCPGIGERKVKLLYDAFHEPFRRVSNRPSNTTPKIVDKKDEEPKKDEDNKATDEGPSHASEGNKDTRMNVRTALDAAFAKYAESVRKRDRKGNSVNQGTGDANAGKSSSKPQKDLPSGV